MIISLITLLIYVAIFAALVWLVLWVLQSIGVALPPQVVRIVWVIVALLVLLWIVQVFLGGAPLPRLAELSIHART